MSIGKMIRDRRLALGLTLEQVGDFCGVGKSTVRKWETGQIREMKRDKIALLASVLNMSPVDFIEDAPELPTRSLDADRLEAMHLNPRLGLLFDRTRKMDDAAVEAMLKISEEILKERDND